MNKLPERIRIKDIARLADVSVGTVDRVIHSRSGVSEASKKRVEEILKQLDYQPNMYASALASNKKYTFICLLPEHLEGEYWTAVELGIHEAIATYSDFIKAKFPVYAAQMRQIAEANEEGEAGLAQFHDLDVEFHTLILHESGNELFAALSDTIATVLRGRVELGKYPMKPKPDALDAHDAVADAIAKGEPERARSAMLDIVDEVARALNFF